MLFRSRLGYGHAEGKTGGDAVKEVIGDALRNAAMRFGAALDLWHKGDLHSSNEPEKKQDDGAKKTENKKQTPPETDYTKYKMKLKTKTKSDAGKSLADLGAQKVLNIHDFLSDKSKKTPYKVTPDEAEFLICAYKFLQSVGCFPPDDNFENQEIT